jgi:phosphoribosylaminoimidazole-succinocarboxamide synthase
MEPFSPSPPLFETRISGLKRIHQGKVRDIYDVDSEHLLIVATDRLSAFDVVLPDPIPFKGEVLTRISKFWFAHTSHMTPNHLCDLRVEDVVDDAAERAQLAGRAMVVKKLKPLPVEAVARGYLIGSGFRDYLEHGAVSGIQLPAGLGLAQRLPAPIFTPAYKAPVGQHDENIDFNAVVQLVGAEFAASIKRITLDIYRYASEHARARAIIIADTKFEFGRDGDGRIILIDEVMTPDSSRFWAADAYRPGQPQPSFDKQPLRDYLDAERRAGRWNGEAPAPALPAAVVEATSQRYLEAFRRITGTDLKIA